MSNSLKDLRFGLSTPKYVKNNLTKEKVSRYITIKTSVEMRSKEAEMPLSNSRMTIGGVQTFPICGRVAMLTTQVSVLQKSFQ